MAASLTMSRRVAGAALIALPLLPVYELLRTTRTGHAGSYSVLMYELYAEVMWAGVLLVLPIALIGGLLATRVRERIRVPGFRFAGSHTIVAAGLAVLSFACTLAFSVTVLEGKPNLIDALVQALHARFWSEGRLAGPMSAGSEFWTIQNALFTERGWVSQYPPGHVALLAIGFVLGVPAAVGPALAAVTVFFAALLARRLFPTDSLTALVAPFLLAVSPFFIGLSGAFMNHVTAAAFTTAGAYFLVRAWQDRPAWSYLAGLAFAYSLATRPLSTLAMGTAIALTAPMLSLRPVTPKTFALINLRAVAGAAPIVILLLTYNAYFFGSPLRTGYDLAMGPAMSLGMHRDPWGNLYGLREAIGYTAGDLLGLTIHLLETPLPAVPLIGVFLLVAKRLEPGVRLVAAWAVAPVITNFLYWHHGVFMGPRMLHEAAPAWIILATAAAVGLVRLTPQGWDRFDAKAALSTAITGSVVVGLLSGAGQRLSSYGGEWFEIMRLPMPAVESPALVFVHGGWTGRVAMSLASAGYRLDMIETLMRQNSTCEVHGLAMKELDGRHAAAAALLAELDTVARNDRLPITVEIAPGDRIRAWPGEQLTPECSREAASDRFGILDLSPLVWQGDLPASEESGVMFVRDFGPQRNQALLRAHSDRTPFVYGIFEQDADPVALPYDSAMSLLWGTAGTHAIVEGAQLGDDQFARRRR